MGTGEAPGARRWWTLGVMCLSLLIVGIDTSILNVTLPTLVRELGASTSELQWIVDSYVVVFAGLLLVMGSVADQYGRKGVLTIGLLIFGAGSGAAALATSSTQLILCRVVMGVGAAMIMPATLSIIANVFQDDRERRRAIAYWSLTNAASTTVGPVAGGLLLRHFWWGSVFLVNVPMVLIAIAVGKPIVPTSKSPSGKRLDFLGAALSIAGLSALLWAIISGPDRGWTSPPVVGAFLFSLAVLAAFAAWELHTPYPMLEIRFFADMRLTAASTSILVGMTALTGIMFLLPQLLQFVKGYSPLSAGLHVALPLLCVNLLVMPQNPRLTERFGPKIMVTGGLLFSAIGLSAFTLTRVSSGYPNLLVGLLLMGAGFSMFLPAATDAIIATLPRAKAGSGSAINQTSRQTGQALGVALAGSMAAAGFRATLPSASHSGGVSADVLERARESIAGSYRIAGDLAGGVQARFLELVNHAFVNGIRLSVLVAAGTAVLGAVFAAVSVPSSVPAHDLNPSEVAPTDLVVDYDELEVAVVSESK